MAFVRGQATAVLRQVGLEAHARKRVRELSGGMKQRLSLALALLADPPLLLLDELTANLDSVSGRHLMELFVELNQHHHVTFLISTHDERVMRYARRLIRMRDGKVVSDEKQISA